jgi:hypothetical protein
MIVNNVKLEPVLVSNLCILMSSQSICNWRNRRACFFDVSTKTYLLKKFFTDKKSFLKWVIQSIGVIHWFSFLDNNNQQLYTSNFTIPPPGSENKVTKTEIFENATWFIKENYKIAFILQMMSGPQLNENSPGSLKLRSGVTAYFVVEWENYFSFC